MLSIEHITSVLSILKEYDCDKYHIKIHGNGDLVVLYRETGECKTFPPEVEIEEALLQALEFDTN